MDLGPEGKKSLRIRVRKNVLIFIFMKFQLLIETQNIYEFG